MSTIVPAISGNETTQHYIIPGNGCTSSLFNLNPRDIARLTGKKLSLKEKIGLFLLRHQLKKKRLEKEINDPGKTAFILGLIGLICLVIPVLDLASIPLAILAIVIGNKVRKEYPRNKKARLGIKLGIITLAILLIIGIIVALVLTVGPW